MPAAKTTVTHEAAPRMAQATSNRVTIRRPQKDWTRWAVSDDRRLKQLHAEYSPRIHSKVALYTRIGNELGRTASACAKRYDALRASRHNGVVAAAPADHAAKQRRWTNEEMQELAQKYTAYAQVMPSKSATYRRIGKELGRTSMAVWVKHIEMQRAAGTVEHGSTPAADAQ